MTYGGMDGVKNLLSLDDGKLMRENRGVKVCPAIKREVRMFGQLWLRNVSERRGEYIYEGIPLVQFIPKRLVERDHGCL